MFSKFKLLNFFLIKTKFIYYFLNFNSFFYRNLPVLKKVELLLPFRKKCKEIYSILSFLSFRLICFQKPCYKLISAIDFWKKGRRFFKNKIIYKYIFTTLRNSTSYFFLDLLLYNIYNTGINKNFLFFKKNIEFYLLTTNYTHILNFLTINKFLKFNYNSKYTYNFFNLLSLNFFKKKNLFSFIFFFNLLDFPLSFNYFNLINKLFNIKIFTIISCLLKEHSLFFIKFLNLLC
jgi:hypothetical protein